MERRDASIKDWRWALAATVSHDDERASDEEARQMRRVLSCQTTYHAPYLFRKSQGGVRVLLLRLILRHGSARDMEVPELWGPR
jgi:hypothetical protein